MDEDGVAQSEPLPLFVYGSLLAGSVRDAVLRGDIASSRPARVAGRLIKEGALVRAVFDRLASVSIKGEVVWLRPDTYGRVVERLEQYEGGLYQRREMVATLDSGERVSVFTYV